MATSAADVISYIQAQLMDYAGTVWDGAFICRAVSEAQNAIAMIRPDATANTADISLVAGSKQSLPSGGLQVLDVIRNVGGPPIRKISREKLTELVPDWTTDSGDSVEFFMFDVENPTVFRVYPCPAGDGDISVEVVYSMPPVEFTEYSTTLGIPDVYISAIYEYVYYRCLGKNSKRMDITRAATHLSAFNGALAMKKQSDSTLAIV